MNNAAEEPAPPHASLRWSDGPGQTKIARTADAGGTRTIYRCWRRQPGYDCLAVSETAQREHEARRFQLASLPDHAPTLPQSGYRCRPGSVMYPDAMHEEIWSNRGMLTRKISFTQSDDSPPWDEDFVLGYLRDNGLSDRASTYFRCIGVTTALYDGSLASVETTSVDLPLMTVPQAQLGGGE